METIQTADARALADLQKKDTANDALAAAAAAVPGKIKAAEAAFAAKAKELGAAREALSALQLKKKDAELKLAEAEEGIRKHQRELNLVKDNNAFKALLAEIEHDKSVKDEMETAELVLLDELDRASSADKEAQAALKRAEAEKNAQVAAYQAEGRDLAEKLESGLAQRAAAAAAVEPALLEKYNAIRANRGGLAVAPVHEEPATGKLSCGGCHMGLTPQKALDVKKAGMFTFCSECRRLMYSERTVYGTGA
jgi:hypothetical protein